MSRPPTSRPLGKAPKAPPAPPGGGPPSTVPRRSAGAVPGMFSSTLIISKSLNSPRQANSQESLGPPHPFDKHLQWSARLPNLCPLIFATSLRPEYLPLSAKVRLRVASSSLCPSERPKRQNDMCSCLKTRSSPRYLILPARPILPPLLELTRRQDLPADDITAIPAMSGLTRRK